MSKFIDKLNHSSQAVLQPMGFRSQQPTSPKVEMLLVASLIQADVDNLSEYVAGADAWVLHASELDSKAKNTKNIPAAVSDITQGMWLKGFTKESEKQVLKRGYDFIIFPATDTPLASFRGDGPGKILEIDTSTNDGLLRTINDLPVDAAIITDKTEGSYLTWHHLMLFRRFAALLTKPLLALVPPDVTSDELQALWETGIRGVVVEVEVGQPAGRVKELRQMIDKLTLPPPRKRKNADVLLPRISKEASVTTEEQVEEDEEYE